MSLVQLASSDMQRQVRRRAAAGPGPEGIAPESLAAPGSPGAPEPAASVDDGKNKAEAALQQLTAFIPGETITLFITAVSTWNTLKGQPWLTWMTPLFLVGIFVMLTPLMLLLAGYAMFREEKRAGRIVADAAYALPWFDLGASAAAFAVWAFAVPGLYDNNETIQIISAFAAFALSWFLSQLRRIVGA